MSLLTELVKQDFGISGRDRWMRSDVHSSLVVDTEKDKFYFNAQNIQGNAIDYLMLVRGFNRTTAENFVRNARYLGGELPKESSVQFRFDKLVDIFHKSGKAVRDYWYSRKLTDETIDRYRLGYYDGWFLLPMFKEGRFYNFQCRRDNPEKRIKLWYRDTDLGELVLNSDILKFVKIAFMTEGTIDSILMNQEGFPTVSGANGALAANPRWTKYFMNIEQVFYIADNDDAGIKGALKVVEVLGSNKVKVFRFKDRKPKYDIVDYFRDGGNAQELKEILMTQSVYGFDTGAI